MARLKNSETQPQNASAAHQKDSPPAPRRAENSRARCYGTAAGPLPHQNPRAETARPAASLPCPNLPKAASGPQRRSVTVGEEDFPTLPPVPADGRGAKAARRGWFGEPEKDQGRARCSRPHAPLFSLGRAPGPWLRAPPCRAALAGSGGVHATRAREPVASSGPVGRGAVPGCCGRRHTCCHRQHAYKGSPVSISKQGARRA